MNGAQRAFFFVVACFAAACSSSSSSDDGDGGSVDGGGSPGSGYAALCHDSCAALAPKIPAACASAVSSCEPTCDAALASKPESCRSSVQAYFDCLSTSATYTCNAGTLSDNHLTACGSQYSAYKACH
jgi:hypothetical protein